MPIYNVTGFSQLHDDGTGGVCPFSFVSRGDFVPYQCPTSPAEPFSLQFQDISPAVLFVIQQLRLLSERTQSAPQGAPRWSVARVS